MTIDEVIKLREQSVFQEQFFWSAVDWWAWIAIGIAAIIAILVIVFTVDLIKSTKDWSHLSAGIFIVVMITGIASLFLFSGMEVTQEDRIEEWKRDVVQPYIDSLPVARREIVYIKIDPEISNNTYGDHFLGIGSIRTEEIQRTPLTISYKFKGSIVTETKWYETSMQLSDSDKPYIEYQYLSDELGYGIKIGKYNTKIYLPENYTFTDIK